MLVVVVALDRTLSGVLFLELLGHGYNSVFVADCLIFAELASTERNGKFQ